MAANNPSKRPLASEKRIIVIDDDDSVLMLFKSCLELEGFQVRTARDGGNILARTLEYNPDLIVTDLMMPAGGGYEVIRSLQGDPATRSIPVVLITGSRMDASTKDMMKLESNLAVYLEKPVRPEKLASTIHGILKTMSAEEQRKAASKDFPVDFKDVF